MRCIACGSAAGVRSGKSATFDGRFVVDFSSTGTDNVAVLAWEDLPCTVASERRRAK
jgi:hypothetical protein